MAACTVFAAIDEAQEYGTEVDFPELIFDLVSVDVLVGDGHASHRRRSCRDDPGAAPRPQAVRGGAGPVSGLRIWAPNAGLRLPEAPEGTRSGQRVRVLRGDDGRLALTFQAIPYDQLDAFVSVLNCHLEEA